jgi:hypothetical protein
LNATSAIEDETQPILGINHFTKGERGGEREREREREGLIIIKYTIYVA